MYIHLLISIRIASPDRDLYVRLSYVGAHVDRGFGAHMELENNCIHRRMLSLVKSDCGHKGEHLVTYV